jgi:DNA repair protein RecO (recombination protein O)
MSAVERVRDEPAYLLLRRPYRDSSLLLEALTAAHGRVGLVARGARASRRGSSPQLLQRYLLAWQRRGELGTLTGADAQGAPWLLGGERVVWMWYANELLLRALARDDPHPDIFAAYVALLEALAGANGEESAQTALRRFEWALLGALGYQPSAGELLDPEGRYDYDLQRGVTRSGDGAFFGAALDAALHGALDTAPARAAARAVFAAHLPELIGDRPLQTPAMLRRLRTIRKESS